MTLPRLDVLRKAAAPVARGAPLAESGVGVRTEADTLGTRAGCVGDTAGGGSQGGDNPETEATGARRIYPEGGMHRSDG